MELHRMWTEQCAATPGIQNAFGTQQALNYLVGEKFLNFIEAAGKDEQFRSELPAFADQIKSLFEAPQLAAYLAPADNLTIAKDNTIVPCGSDQKLVAQAWSHLRDR